MRTAAAIASETSAAPGAESSGPADAWWRLGVAIGDWDGAARATAQRAVAEAIAALQGEVASEERKRSRRGAAAVEEHIAARRSPSTSTGAGRTRIDLAALRAQVSVADVLRAHGVDVQHERGRTACPLHQGKNRQAFSYDREHWRCFACSAAGDVFALVMALRSCRFREALSVVAELAGVAVDGLPRVDEAALAQRQTITRRREGLRRWRSGRLGQWFDLIAELEHDADLLGRYYAAPARHNDPDRWRLLGGLHEDLDRAQYMAAVLSHDDEATWAEAWLSECRNELWLPVELRG